MKFGNYLHKQGYKIEKKNDIVFLVISNNTYSSLSD